MDDRKLFCFGYGYTAAAFARRLDRGRWRIAGTTTRNDKAIAMRAEGIEAHIWQNDAFHESWIERADAILISTPPGENGCPAFRVARDLIAKNAKSLKWLGYLSANSVYGNHDGAWVDETTEPRPSTKRGRHRVHAENEWFDFAADTNLPLIVFRLPGIYGPQRSAIDTIRQGQAKRIYKEGQVFNRMHVDDIAAVLAASMDTFRAHNLYNLADDDPSPPQDVVAFACELLGIKPPPLIPFEQADLSDMAKSFYTDNKRVSNKRMKDALGVKLAHPTYREGLESIFKAQQA